jgi:putative chitinase
MATQFTFDFTLDQLKEIVPKNQYIDDWYNALVAILPEYEIETPLRVAAFLAQCAHESGNFRFIKENLNYRWQSLRKVFPKYFPNDEIAQRYAAMPNRQEAIANRIYASRMGNGPEESGDGFRYCGRGLIQLTGKNNYTNYAMSLEIDVEEAVEHLKTFEGCVQSAAWFWDENKLNQFADKKDIITLSKRINGGTIGLEDRIKHYNHALHVLGVH